MPKGGPGQQKSQEHRQKIADALRGKNKSAEHRQNLSGPKSEEHKEKLSITSSDPNVIRLRQSSYFAKTGFLHPSQNPKTNNLSVEYWRNKGYSSYEAQQKIFAHQSAASNARLNTTSHWTVEYWSNKGYSVEEATKKVSEIQTKNAQKSVFTVSRSGTEFLNKLENALNQNIEREVQIGSFSVDGVLNDKIIIEYFGSFWHMHPSLFEATDINRVTGWPAQSKWNEDRGRIKKLQSYGYTVFVVWDIDPVEDKIKEIIEEIENES